MPDHFQTIYATQAALYERMVAREDMHGNLFAALTEIMSLDGATVVEFGAGTGRLTRLLSLMANHVYAFDISHHMLVEAARVLELTGSTNWSLAVADNRAIPVRPHTANLAIEGWSFGHAVGWYPDSWREEIGKMIGEMRRALKPGGAAILFETMGTGSRQPNPPTAGLATLYTWLENEQGFRYKWIRTDYHFESVEEADELTRFFFGDALADEIVAKQMTILPECTGVWWRTFD
jgi:ubiquinone/menaquinone biosynthesis C-methylase UbiE